MQKITPFMWFDGNAEEAADFYTSVFPDARIVHTMRYGPGGPLAEGTLMSADFEIEGQRFIAFNGGPMFRFTEAISLFVSCRTQEEIDHLWEKLSEGGEKQRCGWLKDRFGVSWQIVPPALGAMLQDKERGRAGRVMEALLGMGKIDIAALQKAYEGSPAVGV